MSYYLESSESVNDSQRSNENLQINLKWNYNTQKLANKSN